MGNIEPRLRKLQILVPGPRKARIYDLVIKKRHCRTFPTMEIMEQLFRRSRIKNHVSENGTYKVQIFEGEEYRITS